MSDNRVVKCPLCEGHGELGQSEMLARLDDRNLAEKLGQYREGIAEQAAALTGARTERNFQRDVHNWNPQLPMWRRSPKE